MLSRKSRASACNTQDTLAEKRQAVNPGIPPHLSDNYVCEGRSHKSGQEYPQISMKKTYLTKNQKQNPRPPTDVGCGTSDSEQDLPPFPQERAAETFRTEKQLPPRHLNAGLFGSRPGSCLLLPAKPAAAALPATRGGSKGQAAAFPLGEILPAPLFVSFCFRAAQAAW